MRVPGGVSDADAEAMRGALWIALAEAGIERGNPATWTVERPAHLQRLRQHPAFRWRPTAALEQAMTAIAGAQFAAPDNWGAAFVAFPGATAWSVPHTGWHIDANYRSPLLPARGVKTLALIGEVRPRGGATQVLSGSHRLVHRWFAQHPPPPAARSAELRALLRAHPYMDALLTPGNAEERVALFMERAEHHDGIALRVVELTGAAGDVMLMHPLLMHAATANNTAEPRLMISGGVTTNQWGWG